MTRTAAVKATHFGICQACGSRQKLPANVLSQHGYEVKWSQFVGVCVGRGHLPYEVNCDLIPVLIAEAEMRLNGLLQRQAELRVPTKENRASFVIRRGVTLLVAAFPVPESVHVEVEVQGACARFYAVAERDGARQEIPRYFVAEHLQDPVIDVLDVVNLIRAREADSFDLMIRSERDYIAWQKKRLAAWKIRPLLPVIEIEAKEAARKRRVLDKKKRERADRAAEKTLRAGERAARLIAKYERLVPADIRENLSAYTHPTLHQEMMRREIDLPMTVRHLLSDLLSEAIGEMRRFRFVPDPWKQVEAAEELKRRSR